MKILFIKLSKVFILFFLFIIPIITKGQSSKFNKVLSAQNQFANTLTSKKWAALPSLLSDSLTYIHSFGRIDTKNDFIKNIARFTAIPLWKYSDTKVQVYKHIAILTSNLFVTLQMQDGTTQNSQQRSIEVWKKEKKIWVLLSHQSTSYK